MNLAYVEAEAMSEKLIIDGFVYCNSPVLYIAPHLENIKSDQRQVDNMIFFLECAIALMLPGVEKLTFIMDFSGSSVFNSPAPWMAKSIVRTLDQHYPERLHMAILVKTPSLDTSKIVESFYALIAYNICKYKLDVLFIQFFFFKVAMF
jgi:hypothetical protein